MSRFWLWVHTHHAKFKHSLWTHFVPQIQVLVDVPCTTDRHSLIENDNNIFSKNRSGERRRLPELQLELLMWVSVHSLSLLHCCYWPALLHTNHLCFPCRAAIQASCPGGVIVYSTCTLSHSQNQSVVEQALHLAKDKHGIRLQVRRKRSQTRKTSSLNQISLEMMSWSGNTTPFVHSWPLPGCWPATPRAQVQKDVSLCVPPPTGWDGRPTLGSKLWAHLHVQAEEDNVDHGLWRDLVVEDVSSATAFGLLSCTSTWKPALMTGWMQTEMFFY